MCKRLASPTLLAAWIIWKQHNSCIFDGDQPPIRQVIDMIKAEVVLWELEPLAYTLSSH
jgi:hypothetical protein